MIRQLLILLWNRRKKMAWIFTEQMLVFAVLLFCFTEISVTLKRYREPGNVTFGNVAAAGYEPFNDISIDDRELNDFYAEFKSVAQYFEQLPCVEYVSYSSHGSIPLMWSIPPTDSVAFMQHKLKTSINYCDENYFRMFNFRMSSGCWLSNSEPTDGIPEAVVTRKLADQISQGTDPIGKIMHVQNRDFRIVGIMHAFKRRDTEAPESAVFLPAYLMPENHKDGCLILVQCKKNMFPDFSKEFLNRFQLTLPADKVQPWLIELNSMRDTLRFMNFIEVYVLGIPTAFLVIFAFLGTFGLFWMQSKKRFDEFGLRMAVGSTSAQLQRLIVFESLLLTSFAMIPGLIIVANLYAFAPKGWEWSVAVGAAMTLMWLFAAFSAWYPARLAAKVQPMEALRMNQ